MNRYAQPRKLIIWDTPILRLVKALAGVLKYKSGVVGQQAIWQAVSDRLPDVSVKVIATRYTLDDVVKEVRETQDRELTLNCLAGRADMVYRKDREEQDPQFLSVVEALVEGSGLETPQTPTPILKREHVHTTTRIYPPDMADRIFKRDDYRCQYCLCPLGPGGSPGVIDHLVAWAGGGETLEQYGVASCARCNTEKSDMHPLDYMRLRAVRERELGRKIRKSDS